MTDEELEKLMRDEFAAAAPRNFDAVLAKCREAGWQETVPEKPVRQTEPVKIHAAGTEEKPVRRRFTTARFLAAAAVFALLIGGGLFGYRATTVPTDVVQLDVNPSVEISLNRFGRVVDCRAVNTDADPIVGKFNLNGKKLDEAVEKITTALIGANYISNQKNTVLVGAIGANETRSAKLAAEAAAAVEKAELSAGVDYAVLSQHFAFSDELADTAEALGVSESKAALAETFSEMLPEYNASAVSKLSINELGILADEYDDYGNGLALTGSPSTKGHITGPGAISLAAKKCAEAGITLSDTSAMLGAVNGDLAYYVTGHSGGREYTYIIDAVSGKILNAVSGAVGSTVSVGSGKSTSQAKPSSAAANPASTTKPSAASKPSATQKPSVLPTPAPVVTPEPTDAPSTNTDIVNIWIKQADHDHDDWD